MIGVLINSVAIIVGSLIGLIFKIKYQNVLINQ